MGDGVRRYWRNPLDLDLELHFAFVFDCPKLSLAAPHSG